ncbi:hypothetical protein HW555_010062, partial [Spodoptera exigua]
CKLKGLSNKLPACSLMTVDVGGPRWLFLLRSRYVHEAAEARRERRAPRQTRGWTSVDWWSAAGVTSRYVCSDGCGSLDAPDATTDRPPPC